MLNSAGDNHKDIYVESYSMDYSISSGLITLKGFFQVQNHKEYQNVVIISFVHLEKINIFCFMHKGVAQKLSLPRPLEN